MADPEITASVLRRTLKDLRKRTRRAVAGDAAAESEWSRYQGTLTHYTAEESAEKLEWVRAVLGEVQPKRVLDVGANTGEYSALAASAGAEVVALERDVASADRVFRMARDRGLRIDTIHADLARPTPAVGWENAESMTLLGRLEGQFELVMLLAVIHHLVLMEQIPLAAIVELCARMTLRYLVIEWVPVSDPMYQSLMRGRDLLYGALSEDDLIAACVGRFEVVRRHALGNGRVLFLFEKVWVADAAPLKERCRDVEEGAEEDLPVHWRVVADPGGQLWRPAGRRRGCADAYAVCAGQDLRGADCGYRCWWRWCCLLC